MQKKRITIDLPDDLFKELKAASALRGTSLKQCITEALIRFRATGSGIGCQAPERVRLPLVGRPGGAHQDLSNEDLEQALG